MQRSNHNNSHNKQYTTKITTHDCHIHFAQQHLYRFSREQIRRTTTSDLKAQPWTSGYGPATYRDL